VALFVERAAAAAGTFELTSTNQAAVADVCRRLDGLPLAIELAAVRTRVLSVEQILERLSDRFSLLVGGGRAAIPRHQTLETTIEWSHDLLSDSERTLLRRLCVFAGRFTLEDVEGVCEFGLDHLSSLVEKSLVIKEDVKGVACYRLHETMREYSALKLREAGEVETVGDRAASDAFYEEALTAVAGANDLAATTSVLQARALNGMFTGDLDAVRDATAEGVRLSRGAGDLYVLEIMLMELAFVTLVMGDAGAAKPLYTEALQIARRIDDRLAQSYLLAAFAWFAAGDGQARLGAQLLGAAEATRLGAGAGIIAPLAPLLEQAEESAVAALGRAKFDAELTAGKHLDREAAIRLALGESDQIRARSAAGETGAGVLGKREADVARLVAEGMSNKQIGARLFISERTVDSHVRSILNKLGFNSRAQIAGWFAAGSTGGAHSI
jgi:DNA-binding CsgD family transcriptional regulator